MFACGLIVISHIYSLLFTYFFTTRQQKKKEYQSNMFFHRGTDISRDLIQLENVQGADELVARENK